MLFNSYIFIFLFLPLALIGWYGLNKIKWYRGAQIFLIAMSLWFYAYFHIHYLFIILTSCFANYFLSYVLACAQKSCAEKKDMEAGRTPGRENGAVRASRASGRTGGSVRADGSGHANGAVRIVRVLGIVLNLGLLGYFKYYDFFIENLNAVFGAEFHVRHILLPLGISFFTFQQMSFLIDRCRNDAPHYGIVDYLTFVTFFPQLIAGPIVLHSELVPQFQDLKKRTFRCESFARGIAYFVIGLSKKVLLADLLAKPADFGFANFDGLDSLSLALAVLAYMFQVYFDFSGYCDMAVGIGKMFGVELPDNFNSPYKAVSVREFWRRWHITLGRFFTTYVYIPLGGSRRGKLRTICNTMVVFILSGLWHGANWTFVVWGMMHGLGMVWNILFPVDPKDGKKHILSHAATFGFCFLSFVVFRSDTLADAIRYLKRLFSFTYFHSLQAVANSMDVSELYIVEKFFSMRAPQLLPALSMGVFFLVMALSVLILTRKNARQMTEGRVLSAGYGRRLALLFVWSVISLSGVSTFLYFNF